MNIVFISDFFNKQLNGGAENNDSVLINELKNRGYSVEEINCSSISTRKIIDSSFFIISNFVSLKHEHKLALKNKKYLIYEHDHKYLKTRDPSSYLDFVAPKEDLINIDFYRKAHAVVVLSNVCKKVIEDNLNIENVYNIGCSLWSQERLDFIEELSYNEKNNVFAIMNSSNPIKNTDLAIKVCKDKKLNFDLLNSCSEKEFLIKLSTYKGLVFLPKVLETFSRISAECKMLNCKLVTRPRLLGFASEKDLFSMNGKELINNIKQRNEKAIELFLTLLEEMKENSGG